MKLNRENPGPQLFTGNLIKSVLTPNPGTCWPIMDCNYFMAAQKKRRVLQDVALSTHCEFQLRA